MIDDTGYLYSLLMEGKMDLMFLPAGAVAWLWQYDRPENQMDAAIHVASAAKRAGDPINDAALLRADHNVLVLHSESGGQINVYPDGGLGSGGQVIDNEAIDAFFHGTVYDSDPSRSAVPDEPVDALPDDLEVMEPAAMTGEPNYITTDELRAYGKD